MTWGVILSVTVAFSVPQVLAADVGCVSPESVASTPAGILFKSEKGICLLSRSLEVSYLGAPVEAFNDLTITSAVPVPARSQVRFSTLEGPTLVYDYLFNQWATWSYSARHALMFGSVYTALRDDSSVWQEEAGRYDDAGIPILLRAQTAWIKLADVQGFGRVYRAGLLRSEEHTSELQSH